MASNQIEVRRIPISSSRYAISVKLPNQETVMLLLAEARRLRGKLDAVIGEIVAEQVERTGIEVTD